MSMKWLRSLPWHAVLTAGIAGGLLVGCDPVPGPPSLNQQQPVVSALVVAPDTVRAADLPDDRVANGQALIDIAVEVTARDPDGAIDRVLVFVDPAYGVSSPGLAPLPRIEGDRYGGTSRYPVALEQAELLVLRAFAVDDDSLTSNQVTAQVRYMPDTANDTRP